VQQTVQVNVSNDVFRHKEKAPRKFSKLEKRIESDPRFAKYFARPLSHKTR